MNTLKKIWAFVVSVLKQIWAFLHSLILPSVTSSAGTANAKDVFVAAGKAAGAAMLSAVLLKLKGGDFNFDKTQILTILGIGGGVFIAYLESRIGSSQTTPTEKQQSDSITK